MSSKGGFGRGWAGSRGGRGGRGFGGGGWSSGKGLGRGAGKGGKGKMRSDGHDNRDRTIKNEGLVKSRRGTVAVRSRGRGRGIGGGKGGRSADTVCYQFSRTGRCPKGASCQFKHIRTASSVVERVDADFLQKHCEIEKAHAGAITAIVQTADGIYTASQDKSLKRWKPVPQPNGRFLLEADLKVELKESCFALLHKEDWIFCGLWDGSIRCFSKDGKDLLLHGHVKKVTALLIHENILISGSGDNEVRLWQFDPSASTFKCTHTIKESCGAVHKLRVMGSHLVIGGSNGVALCSLQSLSVSKILPPVKFVADFIEYEGHLIVAYSDGSLRVFDAEGNIKKENAPTAAGSILSIAGLESGPRVVCTHNRGQVSTVELPSFESKLQFQAFESGRVESVMCTCVDGIFLMGHQHGNLQLWQRREGVMQPPQLG